MSMKIDPKKIEKGNLTDAEIFYLQDRGQLPGHIRPIERNMETGQFTKQHLARFLQELTLEEVEDLLEHKRAERIADQPKEVNNGGIVEDQEAEDYQEGWTNDSRRAELSRRGLSIEGSKDELIKRLLANDNDEETDDDEEESV